MLFRSQSSLLPSTLNRLTLSLNWSSILPKNSELYIYGLEGAVVPSGELNLVNTDGNFRARWEAESYSVILKVKPDCDDPDPQILSQATTTDIQEQSARCSLQANTAYTVMFDLRNPSSAQQAPAVRLSARVMPFQPNEVSLRGGDPETLRINAWNLGRLPSPRLATC